MKLNCKLGDMAIVVSAPHDPEHVGKIVKCAAFLPNKFGLGPHWSTEPALIRRISGNDLDWSDRRLRPIRDNDQPDETLQWVDVPREVTA